MLFRSSHDADINYPHHPVYPCRSHFSGFDSGVGKVPVYGVLALFVLLPMHDIPQARIAPPLNSLDNAGRQDLAENVCCRSPSAMQHAGHAATQSIALSSTKDPTVSVLKVVRLGALVPIVMASNVNLAHNLLSMSVRSVGTLAQLLHILSVVSIRKISVLESSRLGSHVEKLQPLFPHRPISFLE